MSKSKKKRNVLERSIKLEKKRMHYMEILLYTDENEKKQIQKYKKKLKKIHNKQHDLGVMIAPTECVILNHEI